MMIPKKNRVATYSYLFREGVLVAKKEAKERRGTDHPEIVDVPNLQVLQLCRSLLVSKIYVNLLVVCVMYSRVIYVVYEILCVVVYGSMWYIMCVVCDIYILVISGIVSVSLWVVGNILTGIIYKEPLSEDSANLRLAS